MQAIRHLRLLALLLGIAGGLVAPAQAHGPQEIVVTIYQSYRTEQAPADTVLFVLARVESPFEVARVRAELEGRAIDLEPTLSPTEPGFLGYIPLAGLAYGEYPLVVTAFDVFGDSGRVATTYRHDLPPRVTVLSPAPETVTNGPLTVRARCDDDGPGGCTFTTIRAARAGGSGQGAVEVPLSAQGEVDVSLDLTPLRNEVVVLSVQAVDAAGQQQEAVLTVYVVDSPDLQPALVLEGGRILDANAGWVLLGSRPALVPGQGYVWKRLRLYDRAGGAYRDLDLPDSLGAYPGLAFLAPTGAVFVAATGGVPVVYEWNASGLARLGETYPHTSLRVEGDYAVWSGEAVFRRQFSTATTTRLPTVGQAPAVSAQGSVAFVTADGRVARYRDGAVTPLSSEGASDPRFDGDTLYVRVGETLVRYEDEREVPLVEADRDYPYDVSNGWLAFAPERHPRLPGLAAQPRRGAPAALLLQHAERPGGARPDG